MSAPTAVSASTASITEPNINDVIVEPESPYLDHPGNLAFQRIVNLNKGLFKSTPGKVEKLRIARSIVRSIHEKNGRFLERCTGKGGWKEVENSEAIKRAMFALNGVTSPTKVKAEVIDVSDETDDIKQDDAVTNSNSQLLQKPAYEDAVKQTSPSKKKQNISMAQLIKLGTDQMTYSKYPVGCRVQYNVNSLTLPVAIESGLKFVCSLNVGKVNSVFMDLGSKQFVYEVISMKSIGQKNSEFLTEDELAYAPGALVNVQFGDSDSSYEGEIIGCEDGAQEKKYRVIVFTETMEAQIFDGLSTESIKYRRVEEVSATKESETAKNDQIDEEMLEPTAQEVSSIQASQVSKNQVDSSLKNETHSTMSKQSEKPPAATITTSSKKRPSSPTISSITHEEDGAKEKSTLEPPAKVQKCNEASQRKSTETVPSSNKDPNTANDKPEQHALIQRGSKSQAMEKFPSEFLRKEGVVPRWNNTASTGATLATQRKVGPASQMIIQTTAKGQMRIPSPPPPTQVNHSALPTPMPMISHLNDGGFIINIPNWLQINSTIRKDLFDYLIGNDPNMKPGYKVEALTFQTGCFVNVRGPEFGSKRGKGEPNTSPIMHVVVNPHKKMDSKPLRAKQMIVDSLRDFVGNDGSKGRLAYDLAAAEESSRCRGSKYNAVYQWNPFPPPCRKICMILIELTFKTIKHKNGTFEKDFHGRHLLRSLVLGHIWNTTKCRMTLLGDKYDEPTKLCDPYIIITGESPADVDRAFEIVTEYISKHQATCTCSYS